MSDEAALLKAIFAEPDEDTPRLAYADWLDERGGEVSTARAEYIRLEIDHARRFPYRRWTKDKEDARKRARTLFAAHAKDWYPELFGKKSILRGARGTPDMSRGFPYRLLCLSAKLLAAGERLMQLAPITEVEFRGFTAADLQRLGTAKWVRGFRKLSLSAVSNAPDWGALADCPYLTEVTEFVPFGGELTEGGAGRIAAADPCPKVRQFVLATRTSAAALAALFGRTAFRTLRELRLHNATRDGYGADGVCAIAAAPALAALKSFRLPLNPMPGLAETLTGSVFWHGLEELDLLRNGLWDGDLARLLNAPSRLHRLELADNRLTATGVRVLAEHPALANITHLNLSGNALGNDGITALVNSPHARNLRSLHVSTCQIGPAGITALAESPHLSNLRELWMHSNNAELKGVRALIASPHLKDLEYVYFGSTTATAKKELKKRFGPAVAC